MEINSSGNVQEQIINHYKKYISLGILEENDKMPSCRELAIKIGVNPKTVEKAYNKLIEEGLIYNVPKKGFFVKGKEKNNTKMVLEIVSSLKSKGVKKEEIIDSVNKVYGGE